MNVSILSIRISNTLGNPLFSLPHRYNAASMKISSSYFHKISYHLLYSSTDPKFLEITKIRVVNTLKSAIKLDSNQFLHSIYVQNQPIIDQSRLISFNSCIFISCFSEDDGGVLNAVATNISKSKISIQKSYFFNCESQQHGGAIYTIHYAMNFSKLCFIDCFSKIAATFHVSCSSSPNSTLEMISIGCFNRSDQCKKSTWIVFSPMKFTSLNISRLYVKDSTVCGFAENKRESHMKFCTFINSKGGSGIRVKSHNENSTCRYFNIVNITKTVSWQGVIHSAMACTFDEIYIYKCDYPAIYGNVNYYSTISNCYIQYNNTNTKVIAGRWKSFNVDFTPYLSKESYVVEPVVVQCTNFLTFTIAPRKYAQFSFQYVKIMRKAASALGIIVVVLIVGAQKTKVEDEELISLNTKGPKKKSAVPLQKIIL